MSRNGEFMRDRWEHLLSLYTALQQQMERAAEEPLAFRLPPEIEDLITLGNSDSSENEREAAAGRLVDRWARLPVHRRRWTRVSSELRRLAGMHGRSPAEELRVLAIARLIEVVDATANCTLDEIPRIVRTSLNRLITEDTLGLDWRRKRESAAELKSADMFARVDAKVTVAAFVRKAHLREREIEILFRVSEGESSPAIAAALGLKADTVRQIYRRSLKKLRTIASAA
jgi:DNA-binding CsgD family transcriptional regulator